MSSQAFQPHQFEADAAKTVCKCGGADSVCGCAPGECTCAGCSKSSDPVNKAVPVEGSDKTVCKCGGNEGTCVSTYFFLPKGLENWHKLNSDIDDRCVRVGRARAAGAQRMAREIENSTNRGSRSVRSSNKTRKIQHHSLSTAFVLKMSGRSRHLSLKSTGLVQSL